MNILIATKNAYKIDEMVYLLEGIEDLKIHLLENQNINIQVKEEGKTLKENAQRKAREISKETDFFTFASDGGVDIPALGRDWNFLKNQRTLGEESSDLEKAKRLLKMMEGINGEKRKVEFHLALAIAKNGKIIWSDEQITEKGYIAKELPDENIPKGKWLSNIWYYPEFGKVFNKLTPYELKVVRKQSNKLKSNLQRIISELLEKKEAF